MRGILAILLLGAAPAICAETLSQRVERYAAADVSSKTLQISGASIQAGRERVSLTRGSLAPVLAGEETIGFFFVGEGSWSYVCDSPDEFPVLRRNLDQMAHWEQVAHWKSETSGSRITVSDGFTELLWIEPGAALPSGAPGQENLSATYRKHRDVFSRLKSESLAQRLAYRALEAPTGHLARGEFAGGKNECFYLFDGVEDFSESLHLLKKETFDTANAPWEWDDLAVSRQPVGRGFRQAGPVPVRLTRVEAEVTADGDDATIAATETLVPADTAARALRLNLMSRNFRSALDIHPWKLRRVVDEGGREVPFDHRNGTVLLELSARPSATAPLRLRFEIEGTLIHPDSASIWLLLYQPWFPRPVWAGSSFTWKCRLKVKKPFVPILNGTEIERREEKDWNVATSEFDKPIDYPVVIAGKYHIEEEKLDGRTFRIASYAYTNHQATKHLATLSSQIIKFYEPFLGPFPWQGFTIVEIDDYGFGVAPPEMMFITREAFSPHEDDLTKLFSLGLNERFAHEIAHQYWGNQVGWSDDENEWLSESFAEYSASLALRRIKGEGSYRSLVGDWERRTNDVRDHATVATADRLLGERSFFDRTNLLYGKGPYLLYALNRELGEATFLTALKTYQSNRKWQGGSTALFENLLEFLTKKSQAGFFDRYFWGTETPPVAKEK